MRAVVQRVINASVSFNNETNIIERGLVIFIGISPDDTEATAGYICEKILNMRIFSDSNGKMNDSVRDINGDLLLISQFTLYAQWQKGNRPSFTRAAKSDYAEKIYGIVLKLFQSSMGSKLKTGGFGADMQVSLINDGPVTIFMDSDMN